MNRRRFLGAVLGLASALLVPVPVKKRTIKATWSTGGTLIGFPTLGELIDRQHNSELFPVFAVSPNEWRIINGMLPYPGSSEADPLANSPCQSIS